MKISGKSEKEWQAESDAHTMAQYQEIMSDKARMNRAIKVAQRQAKDLERRATAMQSVARTKSGGRKKQSMEGKKAMAVLQAYSMRNLVEQVNKNEIQKEDIVQLVKEHDTFFLIYYKQKIMFGIIYLSLCLPEKNLMTMILNQLDTVQDAIP